MKRILILSINFSGVTKSVVDGLREQGCIVKDLPLGRIPFLRTVALVFGFSWNYKEWRKNAVNIHNKLNATIFAFKVKSWMISRRANKLKSSYDCIIQISGTFSYVQDRGKILPHYVLTDYTMQLAIDKGAVNANSEGVSAWLSLEKELYSKVDRIFLPATYLIESFTESYDVPLEKCAVIGYGSRFLPLEKRCVRNNTLLFVGKDFERKGGGDVLAAFNQVRSKILDANLLIVGPPVNPAEGVDGVQYLGVINDQDRLSEIYRQASIFLMPSHHEPFGLVFLEAMAHGLICIGRDIDAMPEILEGCGFVVGGVSQMADVIFTILSDENRSNELSLNALKKVREYYNWNSVSQRINSYII